MKRAAAVIAGAVAALAAHGTAAAADAYLRVVDVGAGLCVVGRLPGGQDFLYDAGHWDSTQCAAAVEELVTDNRLELVVLSHSDSDHLGELDTILAANKASVILSTGSRRDTNTWLDAQGAIAREVQDGASVINLETWPLIPGMTFRLGDAKLTFIAGWHDWDSRLSDVGRKP